MNENLVKSINDDNVKKAIYFSESELAVILNALAYAGNQVQDSDNNISVLDCDKFDMNNQQLLIDDTYSSVEIALYNYEFIESCDDSDDIVDAIVDMFDVTSHNETIKKLQHEYDRLQEEAAAVLDLQTKFDVSETRYVMYDNLYCEIAGRMQTVNEQLADLYDKRNLKEVQQLKDIYAEINNVVKVANDKAFDDDSDMLENDNMVTLLCNSKSYSIGMYATAYEAVCKMLETIYTDVYDKDVNDLA